MGEGTGLRDRLGIWGWHVHTAIFKIDNHQEPTVKIIIIKEKTKHQSSWRTEADTVTMQC